MLPLDVPAPNFALPNQDGRLVGLSSLQGSRVLLYWYPRADTPGCTVQAIGLRDQLESFDELGCRVLGASFDDVDAIAQFRDKHQLGFDLLSDPDRLVGLAYEAAGPDGDARSAARIAYLIDENGVICAAYDVDDPEFFAELVLDDLESRSER